ncbi:MAG: IclR family transcriptional regulator [Hyphomicrobiales bacterium]
MEKTVVKAFAVLEAVANSDRPLGVTELATATRLSKSNVHRLLDTLSHLDFIRRDDRERKYSCTLKIWELANCVVGRLDVQELSAPYMRDLARLTGETVHLSVLDLAQFEVVYIDKIESTAHPVRAYTHVGGRAPAYCVATGKALLAFVPEQDLIRIAEKLHPHTPFTFTEFGGLQRELRAVQENGYAINRGEWRRHVRGVAAPLRDRTGQVTAAIGISGPAERLSEDYMAEAGATLKQFAMRISSELGYKPQARPVPVSHASSAS